MATDRSKQTNDNFFGLAYEPTEELAKLCEGRGNFFHAELVLEEAIALSSRSKQIQKGPELLGESVNGTVERLVDRLSRLYLLFKQRVESMGFTYTGAVSETIMIRAARIDVDQLSSRLHSDGLIDISSYCNGVLSFAAIHNACNLAQLYLARGGSVKGSYRCLSHLSTAIYYGSIEMVELLIARGADVEDRYGGQPLHMAAERGSISIIAYLLSKGANIEARNYRMETTLLIAVKNNNLESVQYLLSQGAKMNATDMLGLQALHHATVSQSVDILTTLLECSADIMAHDAFGRTVLHYLVANRKTGHADYIDALLDGGLDIEALDNRMNTALHTACLYGGLEAVEHLLKRGASAVVEGERGTPLHLAIEHDGLQLLLIVQALLDHGADPNNIRDVDHRTPLHLAALELRRGRDSLKVLELLCSYGADASILDHASKTPLDYAAHHEAGVRLLKEQLAMSTITSMGGFGGPDPLWTSSHNSRKRVTGDG
ncbi:MAG: hypothetical protein Q9201_006889 [Fulgogasparrea decipioides]